MDKPFLTSTNLVIIFAQSLTGLGHLRVTDALYHGLPTGAHAVLLGSDDKNISLVHNIMSQNVFLRRTMEFFQNGPPENIFTFFYRRWLMQNTSLLEVQLKTILERHPQAPKTVFVVATHFGLAHQFAAIKERFGKENGVRVILMVVVTDDTPIHMWAVGGADVIVVPSAKTKRELESYHKSSGLLPATYAVLPYMMHPGLGLRLSDSEYLSRTKQLDPKSRTPIHVSVPISGAAVQLSYIAPLIESLNALSDRFVFHIVAKQSRRTEKFLKSMSKYKNVELITSYHNREIVSLYENLYEQHVIALEITKPSEQAFKALFGPKDRGGAILLFTDPVGRQEWDNLAFLERHGVIPKHASEHFAWKFMDADVSYTAEELKDVSHWRGLKLPDERGAEFILWALQKDVFSAMGKHSEYHEHPELADNGVAQFWNMAEKFLEENP